MLCFEQNMLDAERGIWNMESGIFGPGKRQRFHFLSEGKYFYGTPVQGQEFY